jgi:outer membrane lipoprotein-sorting protein
MNSDKVTTKKLKIPRILFIGGCFMLVSIRAYMQDATELVRRSYELMQGESNYSEMSMTIHRPKWERTLGFKSWSKGTEFALLYITEPAKEKGQVFLKRGTEMWNWVPTIDKMIKIPPSMMMQSWMGSDVTNNDLVNGSSIVDDYSHKILGEEILEGIQCYKIELIPDEDAPVVWGKIISWISPKDFYTLRNEYYNEDGELINIETMGQIKNSGDRSIPTVFKIVPVDKQDHFTSMEIKYIRFNEKIDESFFSIQNMKSVR